MSRTKKAAFAVLLVSLVIFCFSWKLQSFALLGFGVSTFLVVIALLFKKAQTMLIPLIAITSTISTAELVLSMAVFDQSSGTYYDSESDYVSGYIERVPGFGYLPAEGVHTSRKLTPDGEEIYDVVYTIGEDGYRQDAPAKTARVYIYGGSFTFGEGLNDDETLSYFLYSNHEIPSKNVGVHGYGLHQALFNIEQGVTPSIEGVNVFLTSPLHALRSSCKPEYAVGTPRYTISNDGVILDGVCSGGSFIYRVLQHSNVYQLMRRALDNTKNKISDNDIALYLAIIEESARLTRERDSKLIIAYIRPTVKQLENTQWTNQMLLVELERLADRVVDVSLTEAGKPLLPKYYIHEIDKHPSAEANAERASILAGVIHEMLGQYDNQGEGRKP